MSERLTLDDLRRIAIPGGSNKHTTGDVAEGAVFLITDLEAENATLRTRAEHLAHERADAETLADDLRVRLDKLTDIYEFLLGERAALRAEAVRLRGAMERIRRWVTPDAHRTMDEMGGDLVVIGNEARFVLSSTPLSAAALERWKAMERVVEAARVFLDEMEARAYEGLSAHEPTRDALRAALDRTVPREGGSI